MPKVSIIVTIYKIPFNKLKTCVESLINQTYKNIEILLVDDGSPDDCPKICDDFAKKDSRIKVIHQKNKGLSGARNSGVKKSSGEFYTFVDGDDCLIKNGVELLVNELEEGIDVICTKIEAFSKFENINNYPYEDRKVYSSKEELNYIRYMQLSFNGNNNSSCGKLYSKKFTDKNNLYHDEKLKQGAEDLEFTFRVFQKAKKIKFITTNYFYQYINNIRSITRSFNKENEYLKIKCFETIRENIDNEDHEMLDWFYNRLLYSILNSAISGFFSPTNKSPYSVQKEDFKQFLSCSIIQDALSRENNKPLDRIRKLTILLIKSKLFLLVKFMAFIRFYQKQYF